ncbi:MAG: alpha/beta hydrolase [Vicinamibacteria bacterium]|nr:alpha/beta hydrolase [Vicinamibacteria bacterium]
MVKRSPACLFLVVVWLCAISAAIAAEPQVVHLWPNGAPGSEAFANEPEKTLERGDSIARIYNIHNPSITAYLPPANRATGVGALIAPGGAHRHLAVSIEGAEVAARLNGAGIAVFVLKYRLAESEGSPYSVETHSFQDATRALRLIRSRAEEWKVDPGRLGIMGFSAGGTLVGLAGTRFDAGDQTAFDPVERFSSRPDFLVFVNASVSMDPKSITKETPPAFLISAADDLRPSAANAALFAALIESGVPAEIHVYRRGGHGFGFFGRSPEFLTWPVSGWPNQFLAWLMDLGILKR